MNLGPPPNPEAAQMIEAYTRACEDLATIRRDRDQLKEGLESAQQSFGALLHQTSSLKRSYGEAISAWQTAMFEIAARFSHDGGHRAEQKGMTSASGPAEWKQFFEELYADQAVEREYQRPHLDAVVARALDDIEAESSLREMTAERDRWLARVHLLEERERQIRAALELRALPIPTAPPPLSSEAVKAACRQLKDRKHALDKRGFSDQFISGYQQGLAEARDILRNPKEGETDGDDSCA